MLSHLYCGLRHITPTEEMMIEIINRFTGEFIFAAPSVRAAVSYAVKNGVSLQEADLGGADLHGLALEGADFSYADLTQANFQRSNLRGSNLRGARLHLADFRGSDISESDFREAWLRDVDVTDADVCESKFTAEGLARITLGIDYDEPPCHCTRCT